MRILSTVLLIVTFFLVGLIKLKAATISDFTLGCLFIADAIALAIDPVVPAVIGHFRSRQA